MTELISVTLVFATGTAVFASSRELILTHNEENEILVDGHNRKQTS